MQEAATVPRCMNGTTWGCLATIAFLYGATVFNVIVPHLGYSVHGASHLLVFTALTGLATASYLQCVYCDPGSVPDGWRPDPERGGGGGGGVLQVKRRGGGCRFCKKCGAFKPPRAHHCRRCGRCVLRMDHHCAWVNNCIGHGNHAAFLRMCAYLAAAAMHALGLLLRMDAHLAQVAMGWDERSRLAAAAGAGAKQLPGDAAAAAAAAEGAIGSGAAYSTGWRGPFWLHALVQALATAAALPISAGLGVLLAWNGVLCLRNQTTIEYHEGVEAQLAAAKGGGGGGRHPFDLGWHDNVASVCGERPLAWAWPGAPGARGDGLAFATPWDSPALGSGGGGAEPVQLASPPGPRL